MMADEWSPDQPKTDGTDEAEEERRRWEGLHDDECHRDVHGVPFANSRDARSCLVLMAATAIGMLALIALAGYLVYRLLM